MKNSNWLQAALMLVAVAIVAGFAMPPSGQPKAVARKTVVVELFTSEGCSSCPPADRLLTELENQKLAGGAEIIPLGFHVDYWDYEGWRDRFSSPQYTQRQQDYAWAFRLDSPYTPEMVVDGSREFVGNDAKRAYQVIQGELQVAPEAQVSVTVQGGKAGVHVSAGAHDEGSVLLAVTEDDLSSNVGSGENEGRQLHHSAVVRELRALGKLRNGTFAANADLKLEKSWNPEHIRIVAFVQQPGNGKILGAASTKLESLAAAR